MENEKRNSAELGTFEAEELPLLQNYGLVLDPTTTTNGKCITANSKATLYFDSVFRKTISENHIKIENLEENQKQPGRDSNPGRRSDSHG
jgi:hypothetical protein